MPDSPSPFQAPAGVQAVRNRTGSWKDDARCVTVGPAVMLPDGKGPELAVQISDAKAVCAHCSVRPECLELALALEGNDVAAARGGVWGGLDPDERAALARQRKRVAA